MVLINTYESGIDAANKTNINNVSISYCCRGKRKTDGGYIWRYKKEDD